MEKNVIALVGAGNGGKAILSDLLKIPGAEIRYVCDPDEKAPGIQLAQEHGITCCSDSCYRSLIQDPEIDLIFEVTGDDTVFEKLVEIKTPRCSLIGSSGTKIIFHLLEAQEQIRQQLVEYKMDLEDKIIERTEDLERANQELGHKMDEYATLNEKLQEVNNQKTRYLLQATHQLKAPFAAIQSYTDIILEGYAGEITDRTREIMSKVKVRCGLLANSIKEMLELANLKSCVRENLKMEKEGLKGILKKVLAKTNILAVNRNIKVLLEDFEGDDQVYGNRQQLEIFFSVLIENAINYSHDDSNIEMAITRPRNVLTVAIKDYGIGIAPHNVGRIFEEYFRSNEAAKQHTNGNGLGLAIVKEIANIHSFNIEVHSNLGEGTTFFITLGHSVGETNKDKNV
ncbi:MAG: hypothetical protein ISR65_18400 [Bacteriovoracaceae bacterium]|nr:hypothetical protein [Bacteriovoracaceae bacterium]